MVCDKKHQIRETFERRAICNVFSHNKLINLCYELDKVVKYKKGTKE